MYTATSTFTDCEHLFAEIQGLLDIHHLRDSNFYPRFAQNSSKIQIILKRFNLLVSITFNFKLSFIDFYVHSTPKDQCWHQETSSSQFRQYVHSQEETKLKRIVSKNFTPHRTSYSGYQDPSKWTPGPMRHQRTDPLLSQEETV